MNRSRISPPLIALLGTGLMLLSGAQAMAEETFGGLAPYKGRETVFGVCTQCHSTAIILQNRMTRERWDTTITWMQEKQGLHYLPPDTRNEILDYLAAVQGVPATTVAAPAATTAAKDNGVESKPAKSGMYQYDYPPNPIWDWK